MLEASDGYRSAIVGDVREMYIKAMLEIVDPDIQYLPPSGSSQAPWSKPAQLYDKDFDIDPLYATLEPRRWKLDGTQDLIPDAPGEITGERGFVGAALCGPDGVFDTPQVVEFKFSNVKILQALSVYFSKSTLDGVPVDFTVEVLSVGQLIYKKEFVENDAFDVSVTGFTAFDPDEIRLTMTRWSIPGRRVRVAEIIPGIYEEWTGDVLTTVDIQQRGNFACLAIPYGTCTLTLDNLDRRFEPRNKSGVFQSITDRQAIPIAVGVKTKAGVEYKKAGVYYQYSGGWRTSNNDTTIQWTLVDIVGLLADREYLVPSQLPTTLGGWIENLATQLGSNFRKRWSVDPAYIDRPATVNAAEDLVGKKCGEVLRYVCMATGTFPRADAETGFLTAEPFWKQGNKMDLENMPAYPSMQANEDLAFLTFQIYDEAKTIYNVSGNATASSHTINVNNPFIHTEEQALTAARQILSQYGGLIIKTVGRGDPSSEIGDVDTVQLDESTATTGRRMEQGFTINNGILRDCPSTLLQADGSFMYEDMVIITASGKVHIPPGVTQGRLILAGGGTGGGRGLDGSVGGSGVLAGQGVSAADGKRGVDGTGGMIWHGLINLNPGTDYDVVIGKGGKANPVAGGTGEAGTPTTFGVHSSEKGRRYNPSYTDVASGNAYGRIGVEKPKNGTGDGGRGGKGGYAGSGYWQEKYGPQGQQWGWDFIITDPPTPGEPGVDGADGVAVLYYDKPEVV